jgi:hypothetical protein
MIQTFDVKKLKLIYKIIFHIYWVLTRTGIAKAV